MSDEFTLNDTQKKKLTIISLHLGRTVYDLVQCSIDEAILNYERSNGVVSDE